MEAALLDELGGADTPERAESWRYSRNALRALAQMPFVAADPDLPLAPEVCAQFAWPQTQGRRLVFINGRLSHAHSDLRDEGIVVAVDAATIRIVDAVRPLHLVHIGVPGAAATRWQTALRLQVEAVQARLIEQHIGAPGGDLLGVFDLHIQVAERAALDWVVLSELGEQAALLRRVKLGMARQSQVRRSDALFGGRLQRLELGVELAGAQARLESRGTFVLRGREHAEVRLDVRHQARECACDVLWRGVADQRARGIFHGGITVEPGADGSDARLSSKNVLLSALAEIDTQPVLEIHADEVQAGHGATVGQIDERALFYLRSRGIPLEQARRMLVAAFCAQALGAIGDDGLRERIDALAQARLPSPDAAQ